MTINELINELTELQKNGYGNYDVVNAENDEVFSIIEDTEKEKVIIYF